jgi:hypothetical protein
MSGRVMCRAHTFISTSSDQLPARRAIVDHTRSGTQRGRTPLDQHVTRGVPVMAALVRATALAAIQACALHRGARHLGHVHNNGLVETGELVFPLVDQV